MSRKFIRDMFVRTFQRRIWSREREKTYITCTW